MAVFMALPLLALGAAGSAHGAKCAIIHDKVAGAGHNIGGPQPASSYAACCAICQQHAPRCKAWTWHPAGSQKFPLQCLLHSQAWPIISEDGVVSGVASPHWPPPAPPPPPPPPPPKNCPSGSGNYSGAAEACAAFDLPTKIDMMHGFGWRGADTPTPTYGYSRNSGCGCACGRQYFRWDNGPQGFGDHSGAGNSTQWPSTLNMAATFDPILAEEWGTAMGEEFWAKGTNIQEGPGLNIARIEKNGRTFEYLSGEDPVLGGVLGVPLVAGIQKNVMAIAKHYILNNQETDRSGGNMIADEKTMMELYGPPFEAVAPTVAGYMCSYNRVNGVYACENPMTLKTMLRERYNFSGFVVSDWGATHSVSPAINAGLNIDMPDNGRFSQASIHAAIAAGNVSEAQVHESCMRIMTQWYKLPVGTRYPCGGGVCLHHNVSSAAHKALARKLSAMSTVLLKNDGALLPLKPSKTLKIALIGSDASTGTYTAGTGSGGVQDSNVAVTPLAAMQARGMDVVYEPGATAAAAKAAAKAADVAIIFGSAHSGEGRDRTAIPTCTDLLFNMEPGGARMEDVIEAVASVQKKTIVVAAVPGQILTDWRGVVPAILIPFLPGEQYGHAITDILFGAVTPQAKLPLSFPNKDNEQGMSVAQWPGLNSTEFPGSKDAHYTEGQIVGYRWYDKHKVKPAFAFGHGLSYGSSNYSALKVDTVSFPGGSASWIVRFTVTTTAGSCDTAQVYLGYPNAKADPTVPAKVLRGFKKTCTGGPEPMSFTLTARDVSSCDVEAQAWKVVPGVFGVFVGASSQDIRLTGSLTVKAVY